MCCCTVEAKVRASASPLQYLVQAVVPPGSMIRTCHPSSSLATRTAYRFGAWGEEGGEVAWGSVIG